MAEMGLPVESAPAGLAGAVQEAQAPGLFYGWAMIWTLLGIFAGGMALNLTPCVYPLIPITVSYFGGRATRRPRTGKADWWSTVFVICWGLPSPTRSSV